MCDRNDFVLGHSWEGKPITLDGLADDPLLIKQIRDIGFFGHLVIRVLGIYRKDLFDEGKNFQDGIKSGELAEYSGRKLC